MFKIVRNLVHSKPFYTTFCCRTYGHPVDDGCRGELLQERSECRVSMHKVHTNGYVCKLCIAISEKEWEHQNDCRMLAFFFLQIKTFWGKRKWKRPLESDRKRCTRSSADRFRFFLGLHLLSTFLQSSASCDQDFNLLLSGLSEAR